MTALVLGVDTSTQSTKVEVRERESGRLVARTSASHPTPTPPVSEQDPNRWWSALTEACAALGDVRQNIVAMSVGGQQHGLVLVDEAGDCVRPAKLWNDTTSADQADRIAHEMGRETLASMTGSVPVAAFTLTKLAWMKDNEPESLAATSKIMLPHDYITWRLTGQHVTDRGDASGTGWFNPASGAYLAELFTSLGFTDRDWASCLPTVLAPTQAAGTIAGAAANELGLNADVLVAAGTGDNMAAALGLGLSTGDVVLSLGSSGVVYAVSDKPTHDASGSVAGFADATGAFLPLVCTLNATRITDVMAYWLGVDTPTLASMALDATRTADGSTAPVLIPYFDGERTPNLPNATGQITGLRTGSTREELALAAHDGVLCGLLDGIDALRSVGVPADGRLHLIGGGSRSAAYRQRCADLWQAPVLVPDDDETVATGAAVQAAAALGADFGDLFARWKLGQGTWVEPASDAADIRPRYQEHAAAAAVASQTDESEN